MALTPRQLRFCAEYIVDLNATRAAIRAGYTDNVKAAQVQGSNLLSNPIVAAEIARRTAKVFKRLEITPEKVLQELAKMAFVDPRKFYREDGSLKHPTELDDETACALAGMDIEEAYEHFGKGQAKAIGTIKKIKITDKGQNLERLGRHLKLFTDKVEVTGLDELADKIANARRRTSE